MLDAIPLLSIQNFPEQAPALTRKCTSNRRRLINDDVLRDFQALHPAVLNVDPIPDLDTGSEFWDDLRTTSYHERLGPFC